MSVSINRHKGLNWLLFLPRLHHCFTGFVFQWCTCLENIKTGDKNNFLVIQKYDLRLFRNEKVRGCGSSVPHRQAIYKAYQSSFLFHTVGSFSDLHCGACWLCCMHGHEGRSNERGLNWRGRKLYELSFVSLNPYAELAFRCIMPGICNDLQNTF